MHDGHVSYNTNLEKEENTSIIEILFLFSQGMKKLKQSKNTLSTSLANFAQPLLKFIQTPPPPHAPIQSPPTDSRTLNRKTLINSI
jgi:hypothetical protein